MNASKTIRRKGIGRYSLDETGYQIGYCRIGNRGEEIVAVYSVVKTLDKIALVD